MANKTSNHILGTSTNLLGFCLIVLTSLHLTSKSENSLVDEFTSLIAVLLTISSLFSFLSIRTDNVKKEYRFEKIADYLFMSSLIGIFAIILIIIRNFWLK